MTRANKRTPNTNRCNRIQQLLADDLFNQNYALVDVADVEPVPGEFNVVDLFSGAGGITCGFRMAGFSPLFGVEMDPDAAATYRRNFPESEHHDGRIEDLSDEQVLSLLGGKTVHVLVAGFPCQGFSVAGARDPADERNQLFRQFVRFARLLKPWFVVGENVPGVVTMAGGHFREAIVDAFADVGYPDMTVQVLESAAFGVPQLRPRAVFVGNRFGIMNPYPKPLLTEREYRTIEDGIEDLKTVDRDPSINHEWTRHSKAMETRIAGVAPGGSLYETYVDAWKRQYCGVPSMTVKENHGGTHIHYELNRTLSGREMARLQSFPDDFIFEGRFKRVFFQVGNAVPPLLAKNVALALLPSVRAIAETAHTEPGHGPDEPAREDASLVDAR